MKNLFSTKDELISREAKETLLGQKGICIWLTGLSGSGKTTIAKQIAKELHQAGILTEVLDGDNIRLGINKNLSFSVEDRLENIRRTAEICKLFVNSGVVTICCLVSPTEKIRLLAKEIIGESDFYNVFVNASLATCEKRDTKGLYQKARAGEITDFTGISSPFEIPENPSLVLDTNDKSIIESSSILLNKILPKIKR